MRPALPIFNSAYGVLKNAIISGYFPLQSCVLTYCGNLFRSKLRSSASLPTIARTMANSVRLVCDGSIPSEISKHVIVRVSVIVAAFHSLWARSDKSRKNQSVRPKNLDFIVFPKTQKWAHIIFIDSVKFDFASGKRSNSTVIGYLVKVFEAYHREPMFHTMEYGISWDGCQ